MLAVVRFVFSLFNKERTIFSNYNRAHPHFLRYLVLDAMLSVALVVGGFDYTFSTSSGSSTLERSGAVALSSSELVKVVQDGHSTAYWLGPMSGYKYTFVATRKDEVTISYWPRDSNVAKVNQSRLAVTTYVNSTKVKLPICTRGDAAAANGGEVCTNPTTFNRDTMKEETTVMRGTDVRVVINYASAQSVATMVKNGSSLKRIG